ALECIALVLGMRAPVLRIRAKLLRRNAAKLYDSVSDLHRQSSKNSIKVYQRQHAAAVDMQRIKVRPMEVRGTRTIEHAATLQAPGMSRPGRRGGCIGGGRSHRGDSAGAEGLRAARSAGDAPVPLPTGTHGTSR